MNQLENAGENTKFLKDVFRKYYFENKNFPYLYSMEKREFGYRKFDSIVVRHLSFKTMGELVAELGPKRSSGCILLKCILCVAIIPH